MIAYNSIISEQANAKGVPVVDINALLSSFKSRGLVVGGQRLTTDFLGGLFSLDGIHPTFTGYAVIADEFIHVLDTQLHAGIPPLAVEQVAREDPLVLAGVGSPPSALGLVDPQAIEAMRSALLKK